MDIKRPEADKLIEQLQISHRISVGFYARFLPLLNKIATELNCDFKYWEPLESERPCNKNVNPSNRSAWDFVPLYASRYVYWRINNDLVACADDLGITFDLYIDDAIVDVEDPNPVDLPIGRAVFDAYLFRPTENATGSFKELWEEEDNLEIGGHEMQLVGKNMRGIAFEWDLAEVLSNPKSIINTLKVYTN